MIKISKIKCLKITTQSKESIGFLQEIIFGFRYPIKNPSLLAVIGAGSIITHLPIPLWSKLEAVREVMVHEVSSDTWISSWGMIGANSVLDDLFKYLRTYTTPNCHCDRNEV